MRRLGLLAILLLPACTFLQPDNPAPAGGAARDNASAEQIARDREICRSTVAEYMKTRRNIDDSRREVFAGNYERYGQTTLPSQMANYGDSRSADKLIANCMESRDWPQPSKAWWQKIGS